MANELTTRSENKMVSMDMWNTLMSQATELIKSGFLPAAIKTPAQAIAVILTGRELGIGMMESFRGIDIIEGKPAIKPQLMMSLIHNSGVLETFKINSQPDFCEVTMKRKGLDPVSIRFGKEEAQALNLLWKDNYKKQAKNMYRWRAIAACARIVCPDVIGGLYTPEEMESGVFEDSIEGQKTALAFSEKLYKDTDTYEQFSENFLTLLLDALEAAKTDKDVWAFEKAHERDFGNLNDEDRIYAKLNIDECRQALIRGESWRPADSATPDPIEATKTPPDASQAPKTAIVEETLDQQAEREKTYIRATAPKILDIKTKLGLKDWLNKNFKDLLALLPDTNTVLEHYFKQAWKVAEGTDQIKYIWPGV